MGIDLRQLVGTLDSLREGIQILSPDWRYLYINEGAAQHGRKSREELLGKTMMECYPGIERSPVFGVLERCMRERRAENITSEFEFEDGQRGWFELRIQPCPEGLIVLSVDITEQKRLESMLRQSEKLRALGQMAAGVAHDLKNILNPIALHLRLLRNRIRAKEPQTDEIFTRVEDALRTGSETVDRLRSFGRQERDQAATPVDLNRLTDLAVEICMPRAGGYTMQRDYHPTPTVVVRASELVNAVVNLIVNAIDASPSGGTITVRTGSDGGGFVEVVDEGAGIPAEIEQRMFEPFVTTKAHGTGLGLAMVYASVQRHEGRVTVKTAPGRGTTIRLWFPSAQKEAAPTRKAGRLLVVEDERASREALQKLLEEDGFAVETAASGEEALARLEAGLPDVLVVDLTLPGVDGTAVVRAARAGNAALPVVIMSGISEASEALAAMLSQPRTEHLGKPIDIERLTAVLERVLTPGNTPEPGR